MNFHTHFSDESAHNASTTFEHMKIFIHWMYANKLFLEYGIIYDTAYECSKQYRCVDTMWLLSVL